MTIHNPATTDPMVVYFEKMEAKEELSQKLGLIHLSPQEVTREALEEASLKLISDQVVLLLQELTPSIRKKIALDILGESVREVISDVQGVHAADTSDHGGLN